MLIPDVPVSGGYAGPYSDPTTGQNLTGGTVEGFGLWPQSPLSTGSKGVLVVQNAMSPAYWNLFWYMPWDSCGLQNWGATYTPVSLGDQQLYQIELSGVLMPNYYTTQKGEALDCYQYNLEAATTRFAVAGDIPQTITLGSEVPFTTQYGMPMLYVYDEQGNIAATENATSVSSDGGQATFPLPATLPASGYSLAVVNRTGDSYQYSPAGTNLLSVATSTTIQGNPYGVTVGAQTDAYEDRDTCDRSQSSGSSYVTFPVVSLYSDNQVLIDGASVTVGANPTAVVAYSGPDVNESSSDDCGSYRDTYSGMTRAIVANSGSNTVTILDLVNDESLGNVTVGNQPVAIAVSSDGSTAYVANYTDGTVTSVDLIDEGPVTTVAVGGKPTSVALTSSGVLWVGGVGFLTEIEAQSMTVTATESTAGKTITSMAYSDGAGQLVATSVDTTGNMYEDQIDPATVTAGGSYEPVASNQISTIGTHLNTRTNTQVRSFTATLASTPVLNTNQPGAPPIIVQDDWAVIAATPTGFTISDIHGHNVLVSQTTSSPITAIAVDPNLAVAYLVMPDSNTLLTVPLPGMTGSSQ